MQKKGEGARRTGTQQHSRNKSATEFDDSLCLVTLRTRACACRYSTICSGTCGVLCITHIQDQDVHTAHNMQRKRHPSLEARRGARIGTSLLAAAALWLLCVFFYVFFRVFFCVFSVHSSTFY